MKKVKWISVLILAIMILQTLLPIIAIAEASITTAIYEIYTIDDLVAFSTSVNSGNSYKGRTVKLMDNLDFQDMKSYANSNLMDNLTRGDGFIPIGNKDSIFKGTFDGQGFEIKNLYINSKENYVGLFGYLDGATIKNLRISGSIVGCDYESQEKDFSCHRYIGGIVGYSVNSYIEKCSNKCDVQGKGSRGSMSFVGRYFWTVR